MKINIKHSSGSYPVFISKSNIGVEIRKSGLIKDRDIFVIIDSNVYRIYWKDLKKIFNKVKASNIYKFNVNEANKSFIELNKILNAMLKNGCRKDTLLISIGGGITGDIASFAASVFMRGIDFIQIPTTLLAMVDSSIGGKNGINSDFGKNLIGTFHQPKAIFTDVSFLSTLPDKEFQSGFGEILKYSLITGNRTNSFLKNHTKKISADDFTRIQKIIAESIKVKAAVVEQDEREEKGLRKILNFGHTFGHGIEAASDYKINHGHAVVLGIIASLFYSYRVNLISAEFLFYQLIFVRERISVNKKFIKYVVPEKVFQFMQSDKKNSKSKINLVLMNNFGEIIINYPGNKKTILDSLNDMYVWVKETV